MREYSYSFGGHQAHVYVRREGWAEGHVFTPNGTVIVYAQGSAGHSDLTRLEMRIGGRIHRRSFDRRYSPRYIVTLAKAFALDLAWDELENGDGS